MRKLLLLVFSFIMLNQISAQGNEPEKKALLEFKFGKGIRLTAPDESFYMKFELRFQPLFVGLYDLDPDIGEKPFVAGFIIRRARLKFSGYAHNPGIEYKVELGLSNNDIQVKGAFVDYPNIILDAYLRFKLYKNLKLRIGQFKLPGNRERVISSGNLQFVNRSLANARFNLDRDAGLMLENEHEISGVILREQFAIASGEGRNRLGNDRGFAYAGRVEVLPFGKFEGKGDYVQAAIHREEKPKLALGATASMNDNAERSHGQLGDYLYDTRDLFMLNIDMMFKYGGLSIMAEYGMRSTNNPVTISDDSLDTEYAYVGNGYNIQAGYMLKSNWELAARFSTTIPDVEIGEFKDKEVELTLAVSKYIVDHHLKIQADVSYTDFQPVISGRLSHERIMFRMTSNFNF